MIESPAFPRLQAENHWITSPATADYNCIAWSAGDTLRWWEPGVYWPVKNETYELDSLEAAFRSMGYEVCSDSDLEPDHEKVALYGDSQFYTHASRQLTSGRWTSKLGRREDIEHESPQDVAGGVYGEVVRFMRRPRSSAPVAGGS